MRYLFLLIPLALLCACQSAPTTKTDIAALEVALTVADTAALGYLSLPACSAPATTVVCREPAVAAGVVQVSRAAYAALSTLKADTAAAAPSGTLATDLQLVQSALDALQSMVSHLPSAKGA